MPTTRPDTAVAFESQSGRLLATYGKAGSTAVRYRIWTSGSSWSAEQTGPNLGGVPNAIALSADADSDLIMLAAQDANSDLHCVQWDGTAWGARNTLDLNTGETANQPFLFLYGDLISRASFADVVTTKSGLTNVFATTNLSYTITVTNRGPSTATNVVASDTLPAGIDVVGVRAAAP